MPRRFFRRVSRDFLDKEQPWFLRPFVSLIAHPTFLAVTRRSVAGAVWLGLFIGLMPLPAQTVLALAISVPMRVNLAIAGLSVWITNPVTIFAIYFFEYQLGSLILGTPQQPFTIELSWEWLVNSAAAYWQPLLLGSLITATVVASIAYVAVSVTWRQMVARRFNRRHQAHRA